ncbi:hypothetical protein D9M71_620380 [compost metagenome]
MGSGSPGRSSSTSGKKCRNGISITKMIIIGMPRPMSCRRRRVALPSRPTNSRPKKICSTALLAIRVRIGPRRMLATTCTP